MRPQTFDHVALWVADRDPIADFVTAHLGMHVIDRTDKFTLVGTDARRGKLTLFAGTRLESRIAVVPSPPRNSPAGRGELPLTTQAS